MIQSDLYQAYTEVSVVGSNPIRLVTMLYEGAISACQEIERCFESGDIWGRSKAVTKAVNILTELLLSLNYEKGGEMAANLKRLYSYMQCRLLEAHTRKDRAIPKEVERLLFQLLEAWQIVEQQGARGGASMTASAGIDGASELRPICPEAAPAELLSYDGYFGEMAGSALGEAFSF